MNIEHINNIIRRPETLHYEEDLPLVKELIESFPYFAPAYAMLTKMLHADNSVYLDKYLHLTAAYIGDREVLYNYLYPPQKEENTIRHISAETEKKPENIIDESLVIPEDTIEKQTVEETSETSSILHVDTEETHEVATEQLQSEENKPENVEIVPSPAGTSIEEQALTKKINTADNETVPSPETTEEKPFAPKLKLDIIPLATYDYFSAVGKPNIEEHIQEPFHLKPTPAYEEDIVDIEPHSFKEWLERLEKRKLAAKVKTELIIEKINLPAQDKEQIDEIISNFIRKEPKIKPPQTKFFKPEDMAQQSAVEDFTFVTETLANIYLQQELYTKATEAFRRLMDKHPDRREYFEGRIAEVETIKKENKGAAS